MRELLDSFSLDELLAGIERKLGELPAEARYQARLFIKMAREMPWREERRTAHAEILRQHSQSN